MNRKTGRRIVAGIAVLVVGIYCTAPVLAHPTANRLTGFWIVEGFPDPNSGVPDFVNLATFTPGGEMISVDPVEGAGVGAWERIAPWQYAVTFSGFIPGGPETWRYVVNSTIGLDGAGQNFTGPFRTTVFDLNGNVVFAFEGHVNATRQFVEPY
jgi:hypothetical protein